jgi:hypothetical protein
MHQLLQELRKDFGLDQVQVVDVKIGRFTFGLRPLDPSDYDWATGIATRGLVGDPQRLAGQVMGRALQVERATAAIAVASINETPVYEIFGLKADPIPQNPSRPPAKLRFAAAEQMLAFLSQNVNIELGAAISAAYTAKVEPLLKIGKPEDEAAQNSDPLPDSETANPTQP